jgi:hypothetical protein
MSHFSVIATHLASLALLLLAISVTSAVVWRVEKSLGTCFKYLLAGLLLIFASETIRVFAWDSAEKWVLASNILKMASAFLFLRGMSVMRDITLGKTDRKR